MIFRDALPREAEELTRLTLDSKRFWSYSDELMANWSEELAITPDYIKDNLVVVAEEGGELLGYYSVMEEPDSSVHIAGTHEIRGGFLLDNMFVHPAYIQKGIGKKLTANLLERCRQRGIQTLYLVSDPNARGFYEKMGAVYLGDLPPNRRGRSLPFLAYNIAP